ncbi:MAG: hypothetical protein VX737_03840 [Pseudomonadota bacterium]|nr:hypothetical protein [Pseudomonadota bacterium]
MSKQRRRQQQQQRQQRQKEQEQQQQEQQQKESSWGHWFSNVFSSTQNVAGKPSSTPVPSSAPAEEVTDQPNFWSKTKENVKNYFDNISFDGMFNKFSEFISSIFEKITSVFETISKLINSFFNFAKNTKTGFDQMKTDFESSKNFLHRATVAKSFFSRSTGFSPRTEYSSTGDGEARYGSTSGK